MWPVQPIRDFPPLCCTIILFWNRWLNINYILSICKRKFNGSRLFGEFFRGATAKLNFSHFNPHFGSWLLKNTKRSNFLPLVVWNYFWGFDEVRFCRIFQYFALKNDKIKGKSEEYQIYIISQPLRFNLWPSMGSWPRKLIGDHVFGTFFRAATAWYFLVCFWLVLQMKQHINVTGCDQFNQ